MTIFIGARQFLVGLRNHGRFTCGYTRFGMALWPSRRNSCTIERCCHRYCQTGLNTYYAGILGGKDETLLAIYSHMIDYPLYLPNYPMGHLIAFQIEQQIRGKNFADEVTRMLTQGRIIPQLWMQYAVGDKISVDALLKATDEALIALQKKE